MLLENKNAVIYGGGGSIGGAVARALAREGAKIFLAGRTNATLKKVADDIIAAGGKAETAELDAMDEKAVTDHLNTIFSKAGSVDISFNAIDWQATQNITLVEMSLADFMRPVSVGMTTSFITTTAAGKIMIRQRSGVILSITATPGGIGYPKVGGFGPACCALEGMSRNLASELGPHGVRVVNIRSGGSPDSRPFAEAIASGNPEIKDIIKAMAEDTMLKQLPLMSDIANVAVFLVSDMAAKITGVTIDVTVGTTNGLNHKTSVPF